MRLLPRYDGPWCKDDDVALLNKVKLDVHYMTAQLENCRNEVRHLGAYPRIVRCYMTFVNQRCHELHAHWRLKKFDLMTDYGPMCAGSVNRLEEFQRRSAETLARLDVAIEAYDAEACYDDLSKLPQVMDEAKRIPKDWFQLHQVKHLPAQ
jgi:hypothetical protein